jgi:MSHA biogenesis protein MshK
MSSHAKENDPTKPFQSNYSIQKKKYRTALKLQSILHGNHQAKVVINGKILKKGDRISGYRIEKINKKTVKLRSEQKQITLSLFAKSVTK